MAAARYVSRALHAPHCVCYKTSEYMYAFAMVVIAMLDCVESQQQKDERATFPRGFDSVNVSLSTDSFFTIHIHSEP